MRLMMMLRRCKSVSTQLGRSYSYTSLRSKSARRDPQDHLHGVDQSPTPSMYQTVLVGRTKKPYLISKQHLKHPLLNALVEKQQRYEEDDNEDGSCIITMTLLILEALAASTIAQRGVQLVATAHGMTIDNIIKNPSLQILIGGIESVTLGDEEARKRKVQKTILERKGPPTFTCAVEMISRTECRVHQRLDVTVDAILAGKSAPFEIRQICGEDDVPHKLVTPIPLEKLEEEPAPLLNRDFVSEVLSDDEDEDFFPFGIIRPAVLEADLLQVAEVMGLDDEIEVTDDVGEADVILASSSELKQNSFVIKSTTMAQMVKAVRMILGRESFGSAPKNIEKSSVDDIEIEDDAREQTQFRRT
ncbi:unnamed protein product [Arabidopsis halleri]